LWIGEFLFLQKFPASEGPSHNKEKGKIKKGKRLKKEKKKF
jgi:hypothetical protein